MSYIINNTNPFISTKLTEKGRQLLAMGQLNFSYWAIGDSEINYNKVLVEDANPTSPILSGTSRILRPKDSQPNIKYFVNTGAESPYLPITNSNIKIIKVIANNEATERGFFSGDMSTNFVTLSGSEYIKGSAMITSSTVNGGKNLNIGVSGTIAGDLLLLKIGNGPTANANVKPVPHLWYRIQSSTGSTVTVDRTLPKLSMSAQTQTIVYAGGEVYNGFGSGTTTAYWDTGTLSFDSSCDITREDVPVWNMNNVFTEGLAGITGTTYENYTSFGSYDYLGQSSQYLEFGDDNATLVNTPISTCDDVTGLGAIDRFNKSIAILHYTNNTISNLYGEFFHIDNTNGKTVKIHVPDMMYHRRAFTGGTGTANKIGMTFIASGATYLVGDSEIEYVDLIEDQTLIGAKTPLVVGRVFPQLKIIAINNPEIVAAMSYKSNRNWTLPELAINLASPSGGTSTGILGNGDTMYVTYGLENVTTSGLTTPLACQTYTRITNTLPTPKDVEFRISDVDLLPYMKKYEQVGYDNTGFYAHKFKVIYQVVSNSDRPDPNAWKVADFTSTAITQTTGATINPDLLELQNSVINNQRITTLVDSGATQYDITQTLSMAPVLAPDILQFGDEKFFYGNIEAYIGASIYKTMFDIRVDAGQFNRTTNPTRSSDITTNPPNIRVSEVGIYNNNNELVVIGKLSKPVKLVSGQTIMMELSIDF